MEWLTEKNREFYLKHFQIDSKKFFRKRLIFAISFLMAYTLLYLIIKYPLMLIGFPIVLFFGFKFPYIEVLSYKKKEDIIKEYLFPSFLRYFISLIGSQGNVYQTLRATIPYLESPLKEEVQVLVEKLDDENIDDRDAFLEFAEFINTNEAHMIIGMIYEFHVEGILKDDLKELENTIIHLQENKVNELIEYKVNSMDKHANPILVYGILYTLGFSFITIAAYFTTIKF